MKRAMVWVLAMALLGAVPFSVLGQTERGDVTGDGVIDGASENVFTQMQMSGNTSHGLILRNGARANVFQGPISLGMRNAESGILIQGAGTEGNRFKGSGLGNPTVAWYSTVGPVSVGLWIK